MIKKYKIAPSTLPTPPIKSKVITRKRLGVPMGVPYYNKVRLRLDSKGKYVGNLYHLLTRRNYKINVPVTTLLDIGVGRGKTTTIYKFVEHLYSDTKNVSILVSPFKSLVKKDFQALTQGNAKVGRKAIPETEVSNYLTVQDIAAQKRDGQIDFKQVKKLLFDLSRKRIHIISVNSLLRNPGEDHYFPSSVMQLYIDLIKNYIDTGITSFSDYLKYKRHSYLLDQIRLEYEDEHSNETNSTRIAELERKLASLEIKDRDSRKAFMFFDELHESVHNFTNVYLYNIFSWKRYCRNLYIASASFTESALEVVTYLSWISEGFIDHFYLPRSKHPKKDLGKLKLVLTNKNHYEPNGYLSVHSIQEIIELEGFEKFHILCHSKKTVNYLSEQEFYKQRNINVCHADSGNKFDPIKNNVGTTFKTGVNVPDGEPLFIILPNNMKQPSRNSPYGIFSDGVPAILQAFARARNNSEVYVVFNKMDTILQDKNEVFDLLTNVVPETQYYKNCEIVNLEDIDEHKEILKAYVKKFANLNHEIEEYTEKVNAYAGYPTMGLLKAFGKTPAKFKDSNLKKFYADDGSYLRPVVYPKASSEFILEEGQKYLVYSKEQCGKKIYPYVLWAAVNNQFTNLTLDSILTFSSKATHLNLTTKDYIQELDLFLNKHNIMLKSSNGVRSIYGKLTTVLNKKRFGVQNVSSSLVVEIDKNRVETPSNSNRTFFLLLLGYAFYKVTGNKYSSLDDVEYEYLDQCILHSKSGGDPLESAFNVLLQFGNKMKKELNHNISKTDVTKNTQYTPSKAELHALKSAIEKVNELDIVFKQPAFSKFKSSKRPYNWFVRNICVLGKKKSGGLFPLMDIRYQGSTKIPKL